MITRRTLLGAAMAAGLTCAGALLAWAQTSGQPVRVVVPYAAGGVQDILARAMNGELSQALGQTVIVENRAGAGGTIGTAVVAKSEPDGTATAGMDSARHLPMAYFNGLAGIDLAHVPLKATSEAINEVISGRAHAVIAASIGALSFMKDSRIRLLGVTSPQRSKYLPQ